MTGSPRICMAHPNPGPECETFIQALADRLPGVCDVLHGGHMPCFDKTGRPLSGKAPAELPPQFSTDGIPATPEEQGHYDALVQHLEDLAPDVVLAEYGPTGVAMHRICRDLGIPLAVKFHGYDCSVRETVAKYRAGYDRLFREARAVIAVSDSQVRALEKLGAPSDRLHLIPTGVDVRLFSPASPGENPPNFISVGRFVDKKGPEGVLCAFALVHRDNPETRLTMVGDGILRETCVRLAGHLGLTDVVSFPGRLTHDEVRHELARARCFVQHSLTPPSGDREGTPNAVLEASASALPVVATRHGGIPDAVIHKTTGLLCEEGDVEAMAAHMAHLADTPADAVRYGLAGRRHMEENYAMADNVRALVRVLADICQRPEEPR